jgi:hypothetical protein
MTFACDLARKYCREDSLPRGSFGGKAFWEGYVNLQNKRKVSVFGRLSAESRSWVFETVR